MLPRHARTGKDFPPRAARPHQDSKGGIRILKRLLHFDVCAATRVSSVFVAPWSRAGAAATSSASSPSILVNLARRVYTDGTSRSVRKVEKMSPPTTAIPRGRRDSAPAPKPIGVHQ